MNNYTIIESDQVDWCNKLLKRLHREYSLSYSNYIEDREYPQIGDFINLYREDSGAVYDGTIIHDGADIDGVMIIGNYGLPVIMLEPGDPVPISDLVHYDLNRIRPSEIIVQAVINSTYKEIFEGIFL